MVGVENKLFGDIRMISISNHAEAYIQPGHGFHLIDIPVRFRDEMELFFRKLCCRSRSFSEASIIAGPKYSMLVIGPSTFCGNLYRFNTITPMGPVRY